MKIWYVICIWLCYFSISNLVKENSEIVFKSISQSEPTNYLACFNLKAIDTLPNKTTVDLQQLGKIVSSYVSINFNNSFYKFSEWQKKYYNMTKFKELVLNPIEYKDYLILDDKFCLIQENRIELQYFGYFLQRPVFYLFKNDTFDLFKLKDFFKIADQLVVKNKEHPYSNCTKNYSKFKCLNDCFKEKHQLSKYFYNANENETILLNYEYNQTIKDEEYKCLSKCKKDDCKLVHFVLTGTLESKLSVFEADFFISRSEFCIQFFSLICLIENISFYQLISKLFKFLKQKVKKIKKIKIRKRVIKVKKPERYLHLLKMVILLISISCFIYYFFEKIENIYTQINNPPKSKAKTFLLEPEKISLVICVNANETQKEENPLESYTYTYYYDLNQNNMTLKKIEEATDSVFNDTIDEIYLQFQNKKIKTNWSLTSKVLFKEKTEDTEVQGGLLIVLTRCFQIEANPTEPKYQSLLAKSELIVKFKIYRFDLYLLPEEERFNLKSYQHHSFKSFSKVIKKRSNWIMHRRCADYDKKYSDCNSKQNCIDRCVNKRFIETYKSITLYSIIDKDHFTKDQWSNSFSNNNFSIFNETEQECLKEFKDDCYEVKFEIDKIYMDSYDPKTIQLVLYYNVISEIEEEASLYKLLMDVLTMQSVLFGQNIFELLLIIYCLLNTKYQLRNNKYYFYFIYLICLAGFIYNTFFIFDQVLHGDLIRFVYYEIKNLIKIPGISFCFDFDLQIDQNHKLTENYLNESTKNISIKTVFTNITYLNKLNDWITLNSNFTNSGLKVETFYFLDKKCFKIKQDIEYSRDQFYLLDNKKVLKVNFRYDFNYKYYLSAYFFTKIENKMQFSKIEKLFFYKDRSFAYTSNQEITELTVKDQFSWIKNPSLFFDEDSYQNDVNKHLAKLMNKFDENYNLRTLYLPSEKVNSNNEINNDLFKQYCSQEIKYKSSLNSNIQKFFITTNVKKERNINLNRTDFTFELNFIKNKILITNEDNFTKLILNLLNVLSLWFSLCILDLHAYVYYAYCKIVFSFNFIYVLLIRIDIYLYRYAYCYR